MDGVGRRFANLPLPVHVGLLAIVLLALVPLLDHGLFSADEGAALAQVDQLERTGEWTAANPAPDVDPDAEALPLELSFRTADGRWAPFSKHAAYVQVIRLAADGSSRGPLLVSVLGTVA
ncbi:MAG: hypothetical protein H0W25_19950, partial [Acidimicrobiia bacterium]|nr:hypothetical protein [Acidimicrobiia bacterium]